MEYFDYDYYHGNISEDDEKLRREKYASELNDLKKHLNFIENIFSDICFGDSCVFIRKEKTI